MCGCQIDAYAELHVRHVRPVGQRNGEHHTAVDANEHVARRHALAQQTGASDAVEQTTTVSELSEEYQSVVLTSGRC